MSYTTKKTTQKVKEDFPNMLINKILYNGFESQLPNPLTVGGVQREPIIGALTGRIQGYSCPRCHENFGYLFMEPTGCMYFCGNKICLQDDANASRGKIKKEDHTQHEDAAIRFSLGSRYVNASLSKWNANASHSELVLRWIKHPENALVLIGVPNTGKTYFCAAVANYLISRCVNVRYYNAKRLIEEVQKGIGADVNQYETIKRIANYDFLILDDLGASTNTDWQKEIFLDLIDQRYSGRFPTIITSNLNHDVMRDVLGERTARRVFSKDSLVITLGPEYER